MHLDAEVATTTLDAERERLRRLDVGTLERLLAESDALIGRALAAAEGKHQGVARGQEH